MTLSAINQYGDVLSIPALNTEGAVRLPFDQTVSVSTAVLPAGAYLVSLTESAFLRIAPTGAAGDLAGSFLVPAGGAAYFLVGVGDKVHAKGVEGAGSVLLTPLK